MKLNIILFIAGIGLGFFGGCASNEIKMSPLEKLTEKNPSLAGYAACLRAMQVKGQSAGGNVMLCDKALQAYLMESEMDSCVEAFGENNSILGEKMSEKTLCYLIVYKRRDELKAVLYDSK